MLTFVYIFTSLLSRRVASENGRWIYMVGQKVGTKRLARYDLPSVF